MTALNKVISRLDGAFALGVLCTDFPDELIVARQNAPLTIGFGQGEFYCASDVTALVHHTTTILTLENGEIARLTPLGVEIYDFAGKRLRKTPRTLDWSPVTVEKQGYRHFMLKEIYEQPKTIHDAMRGRVNSLEGWIKMSGLDEYANRMSDRSKKDLAP